jgi:hypothetical protein
MVKFECTIKYKQDNKNNIPYLDYIRFVYIGQNNSQYYTNILGENRYFGYASGYFYKSANKMLTDLGRQLIIVFEFNNKKINFIF